MRLCMGCGVPVWTGSHEDLNDESGAYLKEAIKAGEAELIRAYTEEGEPVCGECVPDVADCVPSEEDRP